MGEGVFREWEESMVVRGSMCVWACGCQGSVGGGKYAGESVGVGV